MIDPKNANRKVKVIAEYPDMILELGQIIDWPYGRIYVTQQTKVDPSDYPHLFEIIN